VASNSPDFLTDDERGYYQAFDDLFESKGWYQLTALLREEVDDLPRRAFTSAGDFLALQTARAKVTAIEELLSYQNVINAARDSIVQGRQYEAAVDADI
jgi:hypothetical protein